MSEETSEGRSEIERLVDVLMCTPAALVQSATEELEKLLEKGRHRVDGQLHTARVVGQVAVQAALRQAEQALEAVFARVTGGGASPRGSTASTTSADHLRTNETGASGNGDATAWVAPGPVATESAARPRMGLAIPGYDSLSASQVVQRLDGLSRDELEDVRDHEFSHRHRRTILNRADQLLSGSATDQSS
jgi:hypothetical protein